MNLMKLSISKKIFSRLFFVLIALIATLSIQAQDSNTVSGTVTDSKTSEPLIGVTVRLKDSANGAITDYDGNFTLKNVPAGGILEFSYVGYDVQELTAKPNMKVKLKESDALLDEVVVIGYGSVKRKDVTTAISSVSGKDIDERPLISAGQAMQGKAAGVSVIQPNGAPGGETSIRVRGTTSMNGSNDPLYVVDGVPVDNINFIAPTDIADIQILKDASSAAIYGSRAANGVILITTKSGKTGVAKISVNAQLTLNKVSEKIKPINAREYTELQKEIGIIKGLPDNLTDQTNWFDEAYTTGVTQSYQVSVSDGTEKLKYMLSGGYLDEKGVLNTAFYKRYNFRANIDNQVRSWLTVNANVMYSDYTKNGINSGNGANRGGVVLSVINTPTYAPIWDPEKPGQYNNAFYGVNVASPLENMARSENNKEKENRLIASGSALITFMPDLTYKGMLTLDRRNAIATTFVDPNKTQYGRDNFGTASDLRNTNTVITIDNIATYNKTFGIQSIEAMLGSSYTDSDYTNNYIYGDHYRDGQIETLNAANKIGWSNTGSSAAQWAIMSYFSRVSYNYDSKYLVTVNMRRDGSSRLHPDKRWGTFPSASAAWRISSENFMKNITWLDDLKVRVGWGKTGNQSGLGDYAYLQRYNIKRVDYTKPGQENSAPNLEQANFRAPDLTWETTTQTNLGFDFTAFKSRLTFNMDLYYKKTTDLLMNVTLPGTGQAASSIQRNEGEMTNKGVEFAVSSRNLQGVFSWNTDFNISFNRNKLTKLALQKNYPGGVTTNNVNEPVVRNIAGRPLSSFYGYISEGVDPETGDLIYKDLNGDGRPDQAYIGDPNPDFTYGITNSFSWKNFNLSVFIQGTYGNDIYNASRMETEGMYDGKNQSTRVLGRWKIPGQITDIPRANFNIKNSSYFIEDGSYLRVKDITLSYNFAGGILKKLGVTRLQPYFTASNLLTWTNYSGMDPEVNQFGNSGAVQGIDWGTYPHSKSFVFGVNIEF